MHIYMHLPDPLDLIDPSRDCWWRPIPGIDAAAWVDWVASAGVDCSGPMPRAGLPGSVGAGSAAVSNDEGTGDGRTGSLWMYVSLAAVALAVLSCVARRLLVGKGAAAVSRDFVVLEEAGTRAGGMPTTDMPAPSLYNRLIPSSSRTAERNSEGDIEAPATTQAAAKAAAPAQLQKESNSRAGIMSIEDRINALETTTGVDLDGDGDIGLPGRTNAPLPPHTPRDRESTRRSSRHSRSERRSSRSWTKMGSSKPSIERV